MAACEWEFADSSEKGLPAFESDRFRADRNDSHIDTVHPEPAKPERVMGTRGNTCDTEAQTVIISPADQPICQMDCALEEAYGGGGGMQM